MGMQKCHECGHQVASSAKACPQCGAKPKKQVGVIGWVFAALVVVMMFKCQTDSAERSQKRAEAEAQLAAAEAAKSPEQKAREAKEAARKEAQFQTTVTVLRAVKESMKNPASFELVSVGANDAGDLVCVQYRGTNSFNAIITDSAVFAKGKLHKSDAWNTYCAGKTLTDMSAAKYGM